MIVVIAVEMAVSSLEIVMAVTMVEAFSLVARGRALESVDGEGAGMLKEYGGAGINADVELLVRLV